MLLASRHEERGFGHSLRPMSQQLWYINMQSKKVFRNIIQEHRLANDKNVRVLRPAMEEAFSKCVCTSLMRVQSKHTPTLVKLKITQHVSS